MPHYKTASERLMEIARSVPFFAGDEITVKYLPYHGYYLSRNGQHFAWFRSEKVGVHWLNDLNRTGCPNFANLRVGTAYQRGVFKECAQNVTPVKLRLVGCRPPRRDGKYIRWGMFKGCRCERITCHWLGYRLSPEYTAKGNCCHWWGNRRAPGMTAKGVKWALAQEERVQ